MDRNETIKRIRTALKRRSGHAWSVTGGRGTGWGWITIDVPPALRVDPVARDAGRTELRQLLGLEPRRLQSDENIPSDGNYRREYVDRAEGRTPSVIGTPYWD